MSDEEVEKQAARCMDCGMPFCHGPTGCPVHNQIPDWNDLVYNGDWEEAIRNLHSTNNFPEFTGRICPAPCEEACTLNLEDIPVAIKTIEQAIADKAYETGCIRPQPPQTKTGKRVAVIGSGPAGMAAAQQLGRAGHDVHVYRARDAKAGGLMRYGIPDFKMEKHYIDRRVEQMEGEGVTFHCGVNVGVDKTGRRAARRATTPCSIAAARKSRAPAGIPGDDLDGVHDAMPYLVQQNKRVGGEDIQSVAWPSEPIVAGGKHVVVVGGGDTAPTASARRSARARCASPSSTSGRSRRRRKTSSRSGRTGRPRCAPRPVAGRRRRARVPGRDAGIHRRGRRSSPACKCCEVDEKRKPIAGTEFVIRADLAFIAIGFAGPFARGHASSELDGSSSSPPTAALDNVAANDRRLPHQRRQALCRRRRAPRPVAGRLGDPRGPAGRARDRRGADGIVGPAAVDWLDQRWLDGRSMPLVVRRDG